MNNQCLQRFRELRQRMLQIMLDLQLIKTLDAFSTTKDYDKRVARMIFKIRKLNIKKYDNRFNGQDIFF